jgi:hypothetical protein
LDAARGDAPVVGALVEIGGRTGTTDQNGVFTITGVQAGAFPPGSRRPAAPLRKPVSFSPPIAPGAANNVGELIINIGSVAGRVLLPNGQPAAGAFVSALSTGLQVNADATGRFVLPNLPAGPTQISAFLGTASATVTVTVGESGETNIGDLILQEDPNPVPPPAPVNIVGTVTLADTGAPAAGASVRIFRAGATTPAEQTVTDAQGRYSTFVPAGVYRVVVGAAGLSGSKR